MGFVRVQGQRRCIPVKKQTESCSGNTHTNQGNFVPALKAWLFPTMSHASITLVYHHLFFHIWQLEFLKADKKGCMKAVISDHVTSVFVVQASQRLMRGKNWSKWTSLWVWSIWVWVRLHSLCIFELVPRQMLGMILPQRRWFILLVQWKCRPWLLEIKLGGSPSTSIVGSSPLELLAQ